MKTYDCHGRDMNLRDPAVIKRLNRICRRMTGFTSFSALVNSHPNYRPTMYVLRARSLCTLANAYDCYQDYVNDPRRAYRVWR